MIRTPATFWRTPWAWRRPFDSSKPFGRADGRPRDEDEGRVPEGIDEEKEAAVKDVPLLRHEGQEHGQDGDGARRRDDAEEQAQQEGADIALLFHPDPGRDGQVPFEDAEQVEPHQQADARHDVFPERPDIPEHPAHQSRR